jgi:hypothetical protein
MSLLVQHLGYDMTSSVFSEYFRNYFRRIDLRYEGRLIRGIARLSGTVYSKTREDVLRYYDGYRLLLR